jgi:signal transduction histidine kinase
VRLAAVRRDAWVDLSVSDDGPGIPPEAQARIFQAFDRLEDGLTRRTGGAGLGLALARRIALAQGGALTLESVPGQGATFRLSLPAVLEADQLAEVAGRG